VRNSRLIAGGAILAVAAIGLSAAWAVKHKRKPVPKPAAVSKVFEGPEVTLTGRLDPQTTEQVDAPIAGILDAWFIDVGQEVYEDQLVGRIRNADLDAALQSAQTAVDRAQIRVSQIDAQAVSAKLEISRITAEQIRVKDDLERLEKLYQRYKNLYDVGALPRLTFEKTDADYKSAKAAAANHETAAKDAEAKAAAIERDSEQAKADVDEKTAALEKAKEAVEDADLHSPADGIVSERNVHQGDKVEESAKNLMTIATDLTKLAVSLMPDAPVLARIHAGQHAFVRVADAELPGEVHEVRGTEVIVTFTSPEPITKLGAAAQVRIVF
jgi:multidrug resistance efflux pump